MAITNYTLRRPTHSAWRDLDDVSNRLSRIFDTTRVPASARSGGWAPPVNVSETPEELALTVELPGLREADISIELENRVLSISGEKKEQHSEPDEESRYHLVERSFGSFRRSFTLPSTVDGSEVAATFEDGVLTVTLPKSPEAKARTIEITK
jgi:HSP20 family protein